MTGISEFAEHEAEVHELRKAAEKTEELRQALKLARSAGKASAARVGELEGLLAQLSQVHPGDLASVPWSKPKRRDHTHHATAVLLLSDLHLDEVVSPLEMRHKNAYDRRIAEMRLETVVNSTVELLQHYTAGVQLDGLIVALLGDIITGIIHAELERTNEAPVMSTIAYWVPKLAGALEHLADALGVPVYIPTVVGNHDRSYMKPSSKQRSESSHAWVIYSWLADTLRHRDDITFNIAVSEHNEVQVYDTRFLLEHGDGFRSAGGIGGLYPSMLKHLFKMHDLYDFDVSLMGHWHSTHWHYDAFVNGSLKGFDQYALSGGFHDEGPSQSLFTVTPERGVDLMRRVHAATPAEGWQKESRRG